MCLSTEYLPKVTQLELEPRSPTSKQQPLTTILPFGPPLSMDSSQTTEAVRAEFTPLVGYTLAASLQWDLTL